MKKIELFFTFILIPIDILMILLSFVVSYKFRIYFDVVPALYVEPFSQYFKFFLYTIPIWFILFVINGLYSTSERKNTVNEIGKIIVATSASVAIIMAYIFLSRTFFFSRLIIVFIWVAAILLVIFGRAITRLIQRWLYKFGIGVHRVIILGHNSLTKPIVHELRRNNRLGYQIVKVIDRDGIEKLETIIQNNPCDEIMITDTGIAENQAAHILEFCRAHRLGFKMTPNLFLVRSSHVNIQSLAGVPILDFKRTPLDGWGKIIKRIFDIIMGGLLIIILSPIMILVALAVKITSKGPVFFRQDRVGLDKTFKIFKYRTMREYAEKEHQNLMEKHGVMFKLKNDPRLTPIGKFLRKTSLDELPQFFNVFKGDMSLIGPRPPMPEEVAIYNQEQKKRLGVKPGITGLWQVSGRSELSFEEWVKLDAYYIENWSFWMDLQIFFKTIWVVLKGRGAY